MGTESLYFENKCLITEIKVFTEDELSHLKESKQKNVTPEKRHACLDILDQKALNSTQVCYLNPYFVVN